MIDVGELSKKVYDRLAYLEFLLHFRGWVARSDLTERFGLGEAAATRDIGVYRKDVAPGNMELDQRTKRYVINEEKFKPVFEVSTSSALVKLQSSGVCEALGMDMSDGILCPPRLVLPNVEMLSVITRAISSGLQLLIKYRSVNNGLSQKRIVPHALFDSGVHWYAKVYDEKDGLFKTLKLSRFVEAVINKDAEPKPDLKMKDSQWNRMVSLELAPHPNRNNVKHPETIEHDLRMEEGVLKLSVRAAVAGYWLHHWDVDCTEDHHLEGAKYQLCLRNHQTLYDVESRFIAPGLS